MSECLTFNEYQGKAVVTAIYPNKGKNIYYPGMGLASEAGETLGKIKKVMRDSNDIVSDETRVELGKEIGDVLWYCAALCEELKLNLGDIAQGNLDKLYSRMERGTLSGSGDNR
jgi:NTP pyrophosphatase (non-canonical NTP hydrolase)